LETKSDHLLSLTRRSFLKTGVRAATVAVVAVGTEATIWEPNHPRLVQQDIFLDRLPVAWDGVRIVQLSDFHYDPYFSIFPLRRAVEMVNPLKPDLVVFTGDFITAPEGRRRRDHTATSYAEPCVELLRQIKSRLGSYAVLGNHDCSDTDRITAILRNRGITVLANQSAALEQDGKRLWIAGIEDVLGGDPDLDVALARIPPTEPVILLAHEPDYALTAATKAVDLQLSGHSHGGQIRFPFTGPLWLPAMARLFPMGLRKVGKLTLYTNVGLGTINIPVRWNCPPEITLFTLRARG
jgi:hypothetical protein